LFFPAARLVAWRPAGIFFPRGFAASLTIDSLEFSGACVMRYLVWALRLLVFIAVLMFALKNTDPVAVKFYADYVVQDVPLIVVMLVVFVAGALFGLLLTVPAAMRRRREAMRLRRELDRVQAAVNGTTPVVPPEAVAPMSPL